MASLEAEGLAPKFHLCDLANLATVEALRDTMVERLDIVQWTIVMCLM